MKNRLLTVIVLTGFTTLLFTGCSKVPQAEIDAANASIEQARASGADVYVPEDFMVLQDSLSNAMVIIESQKSKLIKNYSEAKEHLAGVTQFAGEVRQQAEARKEALKTEIQNTIAEAKKLVESDKQLILEAPRGKEGTTALMAIKGEIDAVESSLNETSAMLETGDLLAALDKANAAREKAASINTELSEVIAKYKANTRSR
jgi:hypothetical protein